MLLISHTYVFKIMFFEYNTFFCCSRTRESAIRTFNNYENAELSEFKSN